MLALPPASNFVSYRDGYGNLVTMSKYTEAFLKDFFCDDGTPALETHRIVIFDQSILNSLGVPAKYFGGTDPYRTGTKKGEPSCPDSPSN